MLDCSLFVIIQRQLSANSQCDCMRELPAPHAHVDSDHEADNGQHICCLDTGD